MNVQEQENDELQLEEQARERIKQQYYGKKQLLIYDDRFVNFDPDSKNDIVGGEKLTYDEYIDIQMPSKIMSGWMGQTLPRLRSVTASAFMRKSTAI